MRAFVDRKLGSMWIDEDVEPEANCIEDPGAGTGETFQSEHKLERGESNKDELCDEEKQISYCKEASSDQGCPASTALRKIAGNLPTAVKGVKCT